MRNVGEKRASHFFKLFERIRHIIKCISKRGNLVRTYHRNARREISFSKLLSRCCHVLDRINDSLGYKIYIDQTNTYYSDWDLKYFSLTKKEYNDMCYYVKYEGTQNEVISSFEFKIKEKLYVKFGLPKEADKRQALKNSSLPILSDLTCDDISTIYDIIYPVISSLRNSYK